MKKTIVLFSICSLAVNSFAQTNVTGIVLDQKFKPLEGATIRIASLNTNIVTNSSGRFSFISDMKHEKISVSYIGLSLLDTIINVKNGLDLRIILKSGNLLIDEVEVINTGYESVPKERATGSFVAFSKAMIAQRTGTSIFERLEGNMPSLQFESRSGSTDIHIRGVSSFNSSMNAPLIILDNFPYEGDINNINPADIESVTMLRDAAATSIWGARAGNGVLVITRKKGKKGKFEINYQMNNRITSKVNLNSIPSISSSEFLNAEEKLFNDGFYDNLLDPKTNKQTLISPFVNLLSEHKNGIVSDKELMDFKMKYSKVSYKDQLVKYIYRNPFLIQNYLSISSGSEKTSYRASIGYDITKGDIKFSNSERLSLNQNLSYDIGQKVSVDVSFDVSNIKNSASNTFGGYPIRPGGGRSELYPYAEIITEQGDRPSIPNGLNPYYLQSIAREELLDWTYNPLIDIGKGKNTNNSLHGISGINLKYKIQEGINLNLFYGNEFQRGNSENLYQEDSFYVRDLVNTFTQETSLGYDYPIPRGGIIDGGTDKMFSHKARTTFSLHRNINRIHEINFILGSDLNSTSIKTSSNRLYGWNKNLLTTQPVDLKNIYSTFDGIYGGQRIPYGGKITEMNNRFVSFYTNFSYNLLNKYIISGSARRDASNVFGVNTNKKWNPLWSIGGAWQITNERWMKSSEWLDNLKLRTTYGHSGNAGGTTTTLPLLASVNYSPSWLNTYPQLQIRSLPNANLKWEDVAMLNLGIDFKMFKGKLWGSFEYYTKTSKDLLAKDLIDPTLGFSTMEKNIGEMKGKGYDAQLNLKVEAENISWISNFNISKNTNTIVKNYGASVNASYYTENSGNSLRPVEGKSAYPIFAYRFAGLDQTNGDPIGYFNNETTVDYRSILRDSIQNIRYFGSSMSPIFGSFRNSIKWKNFDLSCLITFKFNGYKQKETINYSNLFNSWIGHSDIEQRWQKPGDELMTNIPSMVYPGNSNRDNFFAQSEVNIYNASFIRLQDIKLTYSFPIKLNNQKNSSLSCSFIANQLGMIWLSNDFGIDPENYPLHRQKNFSLNISWKY